MEQWDSRSRQWGHMGVPQRPGPQDVQLFLDLIDLMADGRPGRPLRGEVGVFGVTPEVVGLPWPDGCSLAAFDLSAEMIRRVWSPHPRIPSRVVQANWRSLPVAGETFSLMIGDGIFTAIGSSEGVARALAEAARVLQPGARLLVRCFLRPERLEPLAQLVLDVDAGRIRYFGSLKWRLAMSLCDPASSVVATVAVLDAFNRFFPDRTALAMKTGWSLDQIGTIDAYADSQEFLYFPTFSELVAMLPKTLECGRVVSGTYELADRCPIVELCRKLDATSISECP